METPPPDGAAFVSNSDTFLLLLFVGYYVILRIGKLRLSALPATAGGWPSSMEGSFLPSDPAKGGLPMMVTYSDLIQIGILIVGICGLFLQVYKKK